jgi:peptidoglycan hydrolase-like protein with peptidoglycan-binding domain
MDYKRRSTGNRIVSLQNKLKYLGYPVFGLIGVYNKQLECSVRTYQKNAKLVVTGVVDTKTLAKLNSDFQSFIKVVQHELKRYGYYDGAIDGFFGDETGKAVEQLRNIMGGVELQEIMRWRPPYMLIDHIPYKHSYIIRLLNKVKERMRNV